MQPTLSTERLVLRPFAPGDAPDVQRLAGDPEIASTTATIPHPYEDGMAEEWIGEIAADYEAGVRVVFAVTARAGGELLGAMSLRLEPEHGRAELGYWIGRPHWGRGYATEAGRAVLEHGFAALGLERIYAHHMLRNPASGRVMQKLGMAPEGALRRHMRKGDRFEDLALYAILREEWDREGSGGTPGSVAHAFVEAINAGSVERLVARMTDDHVFIDSDGNRIDGIERLTDAWTRYFELVPDYRIGIERALADGGTVVFLGTASGTFAGGGEPSSERHWSVPAAWRVEVRDEAVAVWQLYVNPGRMLDILGKEDA